VTPRRGPGKRQHLFYRVVDCGGGGLASRPPPRQPPSMLQYLLVVDKLILKNITIEWAFVLTYFVLKSGPAHAGNTKKVNTKNSKTQRSLPKVMIKASTT
jgi:hypothetical protein